MSATAGTGADCPHGFEVDYCDACALERHRAAIDRIQFLVGQDTQWRTRASSWLMALRRGDTEEVIQRIEECL